MKSMRFDATPEFTARWETKVPSNVYRTNLIGLRPPPINEEVN